MIPKRQLLELATELNISPQVVEKDYVLGWLLWGIYQHPVLKRKWVFKGGTCLKKCYFETYRFSEDLDFTIRDVAHLSGVFLCDAFAEISEFVYEESGIEIPADRMIFEVFQNPRDKTVCQGRIYYRGPLAPTSPKSWPRIKVDLIADEIIVDLPQDNFVRHEYTDAPANGIRAYCYSYREVFAEKIRALGERTRPRDLYDVIHFFRRPESLTLGIEVRKVLQEKCRYKGVAVPRLEELSPYREECAAGWRDQLAHQLQSLPPFDAFWSELPAFFDWLERPEDAEPISVPSPIRDKNEPLVSWRQFQEKGSVQALSLLEKIRFAGANRLIIALDYRKESGELKTYQLEPYSLRRGRGGSTLLYAVKIPALSIRSFRVDRMSAARISDKSFAPRYLVEFIPEGPSLG
jgi:predicted nucleotidyltransferase component of viral defense system